jgi:glyoxylase-like metal-dependent hydrolase (beta-lactamase superfamily II)
MTNKLPLVLALVFTVSVIGRTQTGAPGARTVRAGVEESTSPIDAAAAALGAANLRSIQFSGWGYDYIFGQAYDGSMPWPRFNVPAITIAIDYAAPALRDDRRRAQSENPPLGGGFQPLTGELRQTWLLSGNYAWDLAGQSVAPAAVERDMRSAVQGRTTQIWLTPHGFIKAAQAGKATTKTVTIRGARKTIVTVTTPMKVTLEGILNDQNLVEHIETWYDNPVLGDMKFEAFLSEYKDFGGVKFPTRIQQRSAGYPILDVTITDVMPNAALNIEVPASIRQAAPAAAGPLVAERVSDGVWMVPGGAKSVAVEFRDHIAVIDAPETEARSVAVIDAVKKAIPNKPIRYIVNTHTHFDHSGGLRTYVAEGATVVTHAANIPYWEQVWANPHTINPDRLAKSGRKPVFEGIVGSRVFRDDTREMAVYHYAGNMHNPGMLMVFLPKERILIEADSFSPTGNPGDNPGAVANLVHWYESVERLRLPVEQLIPIHGRVTTLDEARTTAETYRRTNVFR